MAYESNSRRQGRYAYVYRENSSDDERRILRENLMESNPFYVSEADLDAYNTESTVREDRLPLRQHTVADFHAGMQPKEKDIFIAVMGITGVGKSTFIAKCCNKEMPIVGHTLQACTQQVKVYACQYDRFTTIYLIDTPGFDDTNRSDSDVLRELASWLTTSYSANFRLNGIIYFHRIIDDRMQGSAMKNLVMFKRLCGQDALKNVVLATTMWELLLDQSVGNRRQAELVDTTDYWGYMRAHNSEVVKHYNTHASAMALLSIFVRRRNSKGSKVTLNLQEQMVDQHRQLDQTDAGIELDGILARERANFQRELRQHQQDMEQALKDHDEITAAQVRKMELDTQFKIDRLDQERADLKTSYESLVEDRDRVIEDFVQRWTKRERALERAKNRLQRAENKMAENERRHMETERRNAAVIEALQTQLHKQEQNFFRIMNHRHDPMFANTVNLSDLVDDPRNIKNVSLALQGDTYAWCGLKASSIRSHDNTLAKWHSGSNKYIALGSRGSWYRHYHDVKGRCRTDWSRNLQDEYPRLYRYLSDQDYHDMCPTCVSLGNHGYFFANTPYRYCSFLPDGLYARLGQLGDIKHLWLGKDESYVAIRQNGNVQMDLKDYYTGLQECIRTGAELSTDIEALAMNPTDEESYVIVWVNGMAAENIGIHGSKWKRFAEANFDE